VHATYLASECIKYLDLQLKCLFTLVLSCSRLPLMALAQTFKLRLHFTVQNEVRKVERMGFEQEVFF
jgi:transcriptional antiterminator Rof (Rho-off)